MKELKEELERLKAKIDLAKRQVDNLEKLFKAWQYCYAEIESDYKIIKENIKNL